jgi:oligopeptide/dipeptide ABC transporter ATP-binding protein
MLLKVKDLVIEFQTEKGLLRAVDGISFSLESGSTLGIVGESGCGKSVTALTLMRLLATPPAKIPSGGVVFQGEDLLKASPERMREIRGKDIAIIFQEPMTSLNPVYTVGFQIAEAIRIHNTRVSSEDAKNLTIQLLGKVGIAEADRRFHSYPHELSGGMRQRVMIAMALSCNPKLLIADEPTTALDVTIQAQILELISNLQKDIGMSMLLITHDLGVVAGHTDEVVVMYAGKIVEYARVERIFKEPLHPYTVGLLDSLPHSDGQNVEQPGGKRPRLKGIKGHVPDLSALPRGCRFQDRCALVKPHCRTDDPPLQLKRDRHWVSCFEVKPNESVG